MKTGGGFLLNNLSKTVGKAVPVDKLVEGVKDGLQMGSEYFALKNGVLYWYQNQKSRKSKGSIIVKDIIALEINPKNKLEINIMYQDKLYKLQSPETYHYAEKWLNSLQMIKDMGDLNSLSKDRYSNLKTYTRENAKIVFKDYEQLLDKYETKFLYKIVQKKGSKIFKDQQVEFITVESQEESEEYYDEEEESESEEEELEAVEEKPAEKKTGRFGGWFNKAKNMVAETVKRDAPKTKKAKQPPKEKKLTKREEKKAKSQAEKIREE